MKIILRATTLAAAVVLSGAASVAHAQAPTRPAQMDGRWTPWLGCWTQSASATAAWAAAVPAATLTVCVKPDARSSGVVMTTFADGKVVLEQAIVADGAAHPVKDAGCEGTQTSEWSQDGLRLFTNVDASCNNRPKQHASGVTLFAKGPTWVDIQTTDAAAGDSPQPVRVRRYVRTSDVPAGADTISPETIARSSIDSVSSSSHPLTIDNVIEASAKIGSPAVEAALVETGSKFVLDSRTLARLADKGVSSNVIDLMVAQSFPDKFRVDRAQQAPPAISALPYPYPGIISWPVYTAAYNPYDPFYYYSYYYSPFAYPYYWSTPYYVGGGGNVTIINGAGSSGGAATRSGAHGQIINGRGYTNVTPAQGGDSATATPGQHTVTNGQGVRSTNTSNGSDASSSSSSSSSSGSSSGSSGVSNGGGYSGGGADTGRTAQPR